MSTRSREPDAAPCPRAVTSRAVAVRRAGAVLVNAWPTWSGYVVRSTWADFGQINLAVLLPYVLFVGMLVGYVLGVGLGFAVDCLFFPDAGHHLHGL